MISNINKFINLGAVGALTASGAKVAHTFRPWEVQSIDSIDLMDSCLGSVRYQTRGGKVRRVLPRTNDNINGEWATDKGRYAPLDGVTPQEVRNPRIKVKDVWQDISIAKSLEVISKLKGTKRIVYGGTTDCESITERSTWAKETGASLESLSPVINEGLNVYDVSKNASFFPTTGIMKNVLLIGCDPRIQSPLLNLQLRERYLEGTEFWGVGTFGYQTYPVRHLGVGLSSLLRLQEQSNDLPHWDMILVGIDVFRRENSETIISCIKSIAKNDVVRICTTRANESFIRKHSPTNSYDSSKQYDIQYLVNITSSEVEAAGYKIEDVLTKGAYNIVVTAKGADWRTGSQMVLPILNALEVEASYISRMGGQRVSQVVISRGDVSNKPLSLDRLFKVMPKSKDIIEQSSKEVMNQVKVNKSETPMTVSIVDYHLEGHSFAETSSTMAQCSATFASHLSNFR